jgi:hypothetical protein
MPFVDGPTLTAELVRRGTFEEAAAARIVVPLLDALEYSHGRGVIHRDIKLDNILLDRRDRPYLMDFGIAKTDDSLVKTQTGFVLGSPAYISPEQLRGERLDGRTDVYALGVSLFQMVAGSVPFKYDRMADLANRLIADAPRLATRKPGVSPEMDRIVARALARVRDERYAGAREMREDLEGFLDGLRAPPAAAAPDPASLEDTASFRAAALPPIVVPPPPGSGTAPPTARRASAVVYLPAPPAAPQPPAAGPGGWRAPVLAAAVAVGLLAIAAAFLVTRRTPRVQPEVRPAPLTTPTVAAPVPTNPPEAATAAQAPTATPAPTMVPAPPTPAPRAPARPSPVAEAAASVGRRAVTPPDVDEIAPVALSPDEQRACGGQVVGVSVTVGEDGKLKGKHVISPVSPVCDALALEVLARYRFRPARDDKGAPVEGRFAFTVQF